MNTVKTGSIFIRDRDDAFIVLNYSKLYKYYGMG